MEKTIQDTTDALRSKAAGQVKLIQKKSALPEPGPFSVEMVALCSQRGSPPCYSLPTVSTELLFNFLLISEATKTYMPIAWRELQD